jgi:hypothetical protein
MHAVLGRSLDPPALPALLRASTFSESGAETLESALQDGPQFPLRPYTLR